MEKQIAFRNKNGMLYGMWHYPENKKSFPAVVTCHGFTGNKVESHQFFVKLSHELLSIGVASLRFDFRGSGESNGTFDNMTLSDEISDALKAVDFTRKQKGVKNVSLQGFSMGGYVAFNTANKAKNIKALVLWAPVYDPYEIFKEKLIQKRVMLIKTPGKLKNYYDQAGEVIGKRFITDLKKLKKIDNLDGFKNSALIIHGEQDTVVPLTHAFKYVNQLKSNGSNCSMTIIKDANHTFASYNWEKQVLEKTKIFIKKELR